MHDCQIGNHILVCLKFCIRLKQLILSKESLKILQILIHRLFY